MTDLTDDTATPADDTATPATSALGDAVAAADTSPADADAAPADDKKPGEDADADKKPDADAAPTGAPEAYDTAAFQMPEGQDFDQEGFDAVEPILRELNLDQEGAAKLMEVYGGKIVPMIEARTTQRIDALGDDLRAKLSKDLEADPKVGGQYLEESKSLAARAIHATLPDEAERNEFVKFLGESGMGNNRFLMRVLAGAGREFGEAVTPPAGQGDGGTKTVTQKFYG